MCTCVCVCVCMSVCVFMRVYARVDVTSTSVREMLFLEETVNNWGNVLSW